MMSAMIDNAISHDLILAQLGSGTMSVLYQAEALNLRHVFLGTSAARKRPIKN